MIDKKMLEIAEKIKNKTATKEETLLFTKEFNRLTSELNNLLTEK